MNRCSGNCNVINWKLTPRKILRLQSDSNPWPLAALALQCSTNMNYEHPYIGSRPICWVPITTAMIISLFKFVFPQLTSSSCFSPFTGTDELTPAPNVWVFIAQLVEHCSANTEAMGSNPIEVPQFFGGVNLQLIKLQLPLRWSYLHLKAI